MGLDKMIEIGTIIKTKELYPCQDNENRMEHKELIVIEILENEQKTLNCLVIDGDSKQSPTEIYLGGGRLIDLKVRFATITAEEIKKNFRISGKVEDKIIEDIIRIREFRSAITNINGQMKLKN